MPVTTGVEGAENLRQPSRIPQEVHLDHPTSHHHAQCWYVQSSFSSSSSSFPPSFSSSPALLVVCLSLPFCVYVCVWEEEKKTNTHSLWTVLDPVFLLSPIHHEPDTAWKANIPTKERLPLPLPARPPFVLAPLGAFAASSPLSITLNSLPAFSTHASHRPKRKEKKKNAKTRKDDEAGEEELCAIPLLWLL
ncbi:hypothetical protein TRV_05643 [Trichophyton verrucosum HKI 0517]|uniref:Uncharacterized protein n=1 Tax=Trichophyton verrucosum (strain HKI 0517) TaxID=663202 RepID=D4DEQ4_TRIVH|nr:uncharacterized protein TRV_05643 [Trichophyton verrucosum HKI 0517]EFE39671.1 hypothetical protein TRV_05643 [Trichophyton verrucosum HKI 0517]